jgi:hypothetical protein
MARASLPPYLPSIFRIVASRKQVRRKHPLPPQSRAASPVAKRASTKMNRQGPPILVNALKGLRVSPASPLQPFHAAKAPCLGAAAAAARTFTSTAPQLGSWLEPFIDRTKKKMKGRPRVATGGSVKGTTIMIGDYGLRMIDHHRRISAAQLKLAEATIKQRLRGQRYRLYTRVNCNIGVYVSGNEVSLVSPVGAGF